MDVKKVARLARLQISAQEEEQMGPQMKSICKFFEQISELNTEGVKPLVTPTEMDIVHRKDEVKKIWEAEEALANAPEKSGRLFKVPPVV